jgi:hypothetical protein
VSPVIDKQQFENQSGGWVGAVVIGPKGDEQGVAVEPGQTVWLSEAEQILTANAPRLAEDNPFLEKVTKVIDPESGEWVERRVTPLVPVQRDRFVPANDRPIPSDLATRAQEQGEAQVAATADEPQTFKAGDPVAEREAAVLASGGTAKPNLPATPPKAAAAAQAAAEPPQTPQSDETPPPAAPPEPSAPTEQAAAEAGEQADGGSEQTEVAPEEPQPQPPAQQPAPYTPQQNIG